MISTSGSCGGSKACPSPAFDLFAPGTATDPKQKAEIQENLRQAEEYLGELRSMQVTLPTLTFDRSLILHHKSGPVQTVEVLCISRATVWRRIKDGTLQRVGTGKITRASIQHFAEPRPPAA